MIAPSHARMDEFAERSLRVCLPSPDYACVYHAGIIFERISPRSGILTFDFTPEHPGRSMYQLRPEWENDVLPDLFQYLTGDLGSLDWKNGAKVVSMDETEKYQNFTYIGDATGEQLRKYVTWANKFSEDHPQFSPLNVYMNGETVVQSRMCFDFVNASLFYLHGLGAQFTGHR